MIFILPLYLWFLNKSIVADLTEPKEPRFSSAKESSLRALELSPKSCEFHLYLGLSFEGLGELDKALASFKTAEKMAKDELCELPLGMSQSEIQFLSLYDEGHILTKQKKVDEALAAYQQALGLNSESKEVKINIEFLVNQQGQGQGEGKGEGKGDGKDKNQDPNKDPNKDNKDGKQDFAPNPKDDKKDKGKQYQSKELSEQEAKKILDEIKSQENRIRGDYDKEHKDRDTGNEKPW